MGPGKPRANLKDTYGARTGRWPILDSIPLTTILSLHSGHSVLASRCSLWLWKRIASGFRSSFMMSGRGNSPTMTPPFDKCSFPLRGPGHASKNHKTVAQTECTSSSDMARQLLSSRPKNKGRVAANPALVSFRCASYQPSASTRARAQRSVIWIYFLVFSTPNSIGLFFGG